MSATGRIVWYELLSKDPAGSIEFYNHVAGWTTQRWETSDYSMFVSAQGPLGGVTMLPDAAKQLGASSYWQANVQVADVDASVALVQELGGKVYVREDVPTIGGLAVVADPQGAVVALFTPARELPPHDREQPGEVAWHELYTSDLGGAFAFYERVAGWQKLATMDRIAPRPSGRGAAEVSNDMPTAPYLMWGVDGAQLGGMMAIPPGMVLPDGRAVPPFWMFYIRTTDLDAAIARAKARGATLLMGPVEVAGGQRMAQLLDPQGAAIALIAYSSRR